ncbi:hypothetical protein FBU30_001945, partial [Linnemannia zychae]
MHGVDGEDPAEDEESDSDEEDIGEEEIFEGEEIFEEEEEDPAMMEIADMIKSQKVLRVAQTVETDSDAEEEDVIKVEDKVKEKNDAISHRRTHRNPVSVRGCIVAMLLFMTSQKCNAFQTVMGVFLHCTGCPTRVLDVLSSIGLSVSDYQVRKVLGNMTKDALEQVRKAVLCNDWFLVYDNINIAMKHQHQRINKLDTFENGTAATVILIPNEKEKIKADHSRFYEQNTDDLDNGNGLNNESDFDDKSDIGDESDIGDKGDKECNINNNDDDHELYKKNGSKKINDCCPSRPTIAVYRSDRTTLPTASIFFPNATEQSLLRTVCRHHFSSAIARFHTHSHITVIPIVKVDPLPTRKSITFQLQTMKIDESTIAGNLAVLETITDIGLRLARTWFTKLSNIIVAGDQMTVVRLLSLQIHRAIDPDPYGGLFW